MEALGDVDGTGTAAVQEVPKPPSYETNGLLRIAAQDVQDAGRATVHGDRTRERRTHCDRQGEVLRGNTRSRASASPENRVLAASDLALHHPQYRLVDAREERGAVERHACSRFGAFGGRPERSFHVRGYIRELPEGQLVRGMIELVRLGHVERRFGKPEAAESESGHAQRFPGPSLSFLVEVHNE